MQTFFVISGVLRKRWASWLLWTLFITAGYFLMLMLALLFRFRHWPNYVNVYDWPAGLLTIWRSTPSWADRLMLFRQEWLLEVGYMNYDYGMGISEWSLVIIPWKLFGTLWVGALIAALLCVLWEFPSGSSYKRSNRFALTLGSAGAVSAGISLVSLYWVVCCSTPTWVVGLAILGLGVNTALWLEPLGGWLFTAGSALQCLAIVAVMHHRSVQPLSAGAAVNAESVSRANADAALWQGKSAGEVHEYCC